MHAALTLVRIVLCLSGILSMIIIRTLRKDIANYNKEDDIVSVFADAASPLWGDPTVRSHLACPFSAGRHNGGIGLEAGPWRCVPATSVSHDPQLSLRLRDPALLHGANCHL